MIFRIILSKKVQLTLCALCFAKLAFAQTAAVPNQNHDNIDFQQNENNELVKVMEMRNYVITPGKREDFIKFFKENFVASQEALGGYIIGRFDVEGAPDAYYWLRGFADMKARSIYLPAFYYNSPSWKLHKAEANSMLVDNDNVLLVRPLANGAHLNDPNIGIHRKLIITNKPFVVACYYWAKDQKLDTLITAYQNKIKPYLASLHINDVTLWVAELAENDFPKLPVIQNKDQLVVLMNFNSKAEYNSIREKLENKFVNNGLDTLITKKQFLLMNKRM